MSALKSRPCCRVLGPELRRTAAAVQRPRLTFILETDVEDLPEPLTRGSRVDRRDDLDASRQVSVHPVSGPDEELAVEWILMPGGEVEDSRVLEKAADDRAD